MREIQGAGFVVKDEVRLSDGTGTQLVVASGQKVNVYDTGKYVVGG